MNPYCPYCTDGIDAPDDELCGLSGCKLQEYDEKIAAILDEIWYCSHGYWHAAECPDCAVPSYLPSAVAA
jgi:hypothetical protein